MMMVMMMMMVLTIEGKDTIDERSLVKLYSQTHFASVV